MEAWWTKNDEFDKTIIDRFGATHASCANGELAKWEDEPDSCLALVILLDQFSRNMFRGDPRTFAQDEQALNAARKAIAAGFDRRCDPQISDFFYMPFMHSECIGDQNECVKLMHARSGEGGLKAAIQHREIIARFGRFPHRNQLLGRHTTPAEQAFLDGGGFSG